MGMGHLPYNPLVPGHWASVPRAPDAVVCRRLLSSLWTRLGGSPGPHRSNGSPSLSLTLNGKKLNIDVHVQIEAKTASLFSVVGKAV